MPNQFSVVSLACDNGILTVQYGDSGNCKVAVAESAGFKYDDVLVIPDLTPTPIPGKWYSLFGDLEKVGLVQFGDKFCNKTTEDIRVKVSMQYAWTPFSTTGTTRFMYIVRNNTPSDIVLANYAASNNTDVAQIGTNSFLLKVNECFQPYAWQNSGAVAYLGQTGVDPSTNIRIPETTITIERLFEFR